MKRNSIFVNIDIVESLHNAAIAMVGHDLANFPGQFRSCNRIMLSVKFNIMSWEREVEHGKNWIASRLW
jgi:hypothetical protein